jgi:hypothetical protein
MGDYELRKWTGLYKLYMVDMLKKYIIKDISKIIVDYVYI